MTKNTFQGRAEAAAARAEAKATARAAARAAAAAEWKAMKKGEQRERRAERRGAASQCAFLEQIAPEVARRNAQAGAGGGPARVLLRAVGGAGPGALEPAYPEQRVRVYLWVHLGASGVR